MSSGKVTRAWRQDRRATAHRADYYALKTHRAWHSPPTEKSSVSANTKSLENSKKR